MKYHESAWWADPIDNDELHEYYQAQARRRARMVAAKKAELLRMVEIIATDKCLNALGQDGFVYVYMGNDKGWKQLTMLVYEG